MNKKSSSKFMREAIREARRGVKLSHGGPFGAVIVKSGKIIAKAHNEVIKTNDPTAHAEVLAIRRATKKLKRFDLSDCSIYSTCEPCPMCLSAIYWAKIPRLYYGCSRNDAAKIGFDDKFIYDVLKGKKVKKRLSSKILDKKTTLKVFDEWVASEGKVLY
jgi:guanine deaminase